MHRAYRSQSPQSQPKTVQHTTTHCNTLQHIATHCNTQCIEPAGVAVCCSVLQCIAVCCSVVQCVAVSLYSQEHLWMWLWCVLQGVAVCCSALQCGAACCSVSPQPRTSVDMALVYVAVCCSVLQFVAVSFPSPESLWCNNTHAPNTQQHRATRCNTMQQYTCHQHNLHIQRDSVAIHCMLQCVAACCSVLQHTATHGNTQCNTTYAATTTESRHMLRITYGMGTTESHDMLKRKNTATHCNTLQHTATHDILSLIILGAL